MAIRHRKASPFYKTMNGAAVGDTFMSLIHTAQLNHVPAFGYLVALLKHHRLAAVNPSAWMRWNYKEVVATLTATTTRWSPRRTKTTTERIIRAATAAAGRSVPPSEDISGPTTSA